jgi:glycosyltransferase involved in cell wall biosynthesis
MERMGELYAAADALLVHLKDDPLFRITVPSKTQAYLFVGKPIIMAMRGDAADLIRKAGAGIICEPENAKDIVGAVKNLYNMSTGERRKMGSAGRRFYLDSLSFEKGTSKFEMIMKDITSKNIHGAEFEKNI